MSDNHITPTQVDKIENALEERKHSNDRRDLKEEKMPTDIERRDEKSSDRRKQS